MLKEYIKYLLQSKKSVDSDTPFITDLTEKGLNIPIDNEDQKKLEQLFKRLKNNKLRIKVTDHGVGSRKLDDRRTIASIYKTSSSKGKYGKLLYQLTKHYRPERILELGTSLGVGTSYMKLGCPTTHIDTVEGCPETFRVADENLKNLGFKQVKLSCNTFSDFIGNLEKQKYDLVFIDGHHDGDALKDYLEKLQPYTHDETLYILDDINWSESMQEAWKDILNSNQYNLSIDFFRVGIISKSPQFKKTYLKLRM